MPCYHPLKVYHAQGGGIAFTSAPPAFADRPFELPCGQCMGCRIRRKSDWTVRCLHEAQMHQQNSFITLTYAEKFKPALGSLKIEDWQKFAKRLRKAKGPFRFFHCGEYSPAGRPHYHALIFGLDFREDRRPWGKGTFVSDELTKIWGMGHCVIGNVEHESAAYVAGYCIKKVNGDRAADYYSRPDPETGEMLPIRPEYASMSRRPGLGTSWYEKYYSDLYPSEECWVDGKRKPMPLFYVRKMEAGDPVLARKLELGRKKGEKRREWNRSFERLAVRERVAKARIGMKKGSLE